MKKFIIIAVVVVIAGSVVYFRFGGKEKLNQIVNPEASPADSADQEQLSPDEPDKVFSEPVTFSSLTQVYSGTNFSFKYSAGFKATLVPATQPDSGVAGEVVTVENSKGSGFQVFSMPFNESGPITPERIKKDQPDADVLEPKNAQLDGVQALVFYGYNGDMGETFEVWAVRKGKLYQIAGPKTAEDLIIKTLETWDWK